jgi:chorismate mutase
MKLTRLLTIGTLFIAFLQGGACASAQMTCTVTYTESAQNSARSLASLIDERLSLMTDVARTKWNNRSAIEDPVREQQLLTDVEARAQTVGISPEWAQHFFRLQMEAAKEVQYCLFSQWAAAGQKPFPQVQDLRTAIRPRLDQLTAQIMQELGKQWPELSQRNSFAPSSLQAAQPGNEIARRLALLPLSDGSLQSYHHAQAGPPRQ